MALSAHEARASGGIERCYRLHDVRLKLDHDTPFTPEGLEALLRDLSFEAIGDGPQASPSVTLKVRQSAGRSEAVPAGRELFEVEGVRGVQAGADFWLELGRSTLRVDSAARQAAVNLDKGFFGLPSQLQRNFWSFGLMKLLRAVGWFTLHAAGLVSNRGQGVLLVAQPGSGKSTLAIGLIERGWRYLSDDAVMLRFQGSKIEALALRRNFYVDSSARAHYRHVDPTPVEDGEGGSVIHTGPGRNTVEALAALLRESGPQLFDPPSMASHLRALQTLIGQCATYSLQSGQDLYRDPGGVEALIQAPAG